MDGIQTLSRIIVGLLVIAMLCPTAYGQSIEARTDDGELTTTPQVIQAPGVFAQPLEGPIDPTTYVLGPSDQLLPVRW